VVSFLSNTSEKWEVTTVALNLDLLAVVRRYAAEPNDWPFAPRFDPTRPLVSEAGADW
jgi:hypothetical protein